MNIPSDSALDGNASQVEASAPAQSASPGAAAPHADAGQAGSAWRAADVRLRCYLERLGHPQAEALRAESLRRARSRLEAGAAESPLGAAMEELHRLVAGELEAAGSAAPELASLEWRLNRRRGESAELRSVPPVRLGHMVPLPYRDGRGQPAARGFAAGAVEPQLCTEDGPASAWARRE